MNDTTATATVQRDPVLIDLALQGGGSHGAFTWGVLDRLLEESWLHIDGISGTSAGAMNAAALACGYAEGGAAGARARLDSFWGRVWRAASMSPFQRTPLDRLRGRWTLDYSPAFIAADMMTRLFSPYDLLPWAGNPLREILTELINFPALTDVRNDVMNELGYSSKLNAEWEFLSMLKQAGRNAADTFLGQHGDDIGKRSTLNLDALLNEL